MKTLEIKQIVHELMKLIECALHGSFQQPRGSTGSGLYLRETPEGNRKYRVPVKCKTK